MGLCRPVAQYRQITIQYIRRWLRSIYVLPSLFCKQLWNIARSMIERNAVCAHEFVLLSNDLSRAAWEEVPPGCIEKIIPHYCNIFVRDIWPVCGDWFGGFHFFDDNIFESTVTFCTSLCCIWILNCDPCADGCRIFSLNLRSWHNEKDKW